jgi:hypothetical protein
MIDCDRNILFILNFYYSLWYELGFLGLSKSSHRENLLIRKILIQTFFNQLLAYFPMRKTHILAVPQQSFSLFIFASKLTR